MIQTFPAALQPIIQQGFLDREFDIGMQSRIGFRMVADRVEETEPLGKKFLRTRKRIPRNGGHAIEMYAGVLNHYAAVTDLNMVTSRVGIASQFLLNAAINGEQAARSLDELARHALYAAYKANATTIRPRHIEAPDHLEAQDILTMGILLEAVATLRKNAVPEIDGVYNCYLDPISARQLFSDNDFRQLFTGATSANQVFRKGMINDFLGLRFIPTTEVYAETHPALAGAVIRRPIICGAGALVESHHAGMLDHDIRPNDAIVSVIDGVAMVTREPVDRLQQIIAQSWYWIGGFSAPAELVDGEAAYRRAVCLEHVS
jgi:hypothetical protein